MQFFPCHVIALQHVMNYADPLSLRFQQLIMKAGGYTVVFECTSKLVKLHECVGCREITSLAGGRPKTQLHQTHSKSSRLGHRESRSQTPPRSPSQARQCRENPTQDP